METPGRVRWRNYLTEKSARGSRTDNSALKHWPMAPPLQRHGRARPGHRNRHGAATDPRDEPGDVAGGESYRLSAPVYPDSEGVWVYRPRVGVAAGAKSRRYPGSEGAWVYDTAGVRRSGSGSEMRCVYASFFAVVAGETKSRAGPFRGIEPLAAGQKRAQTSTEIVSIHG